jgi:peptide/nickel transport system permease protein
MLNLLLRRLALGVMTLWVVSVIIFAGTEILPGDVATAILGQTATPENTEAIRNQLGLNRPPYERYVDWLGDFLQGDLGMSLTSRRPISDQIGFRLENTLLLAGVAAAIAVPLAIVLGLIAAIKQGTLFDRGISITTLLSISVPEFFIGYVLIFVVAVQLRWLPSMSSVNVRMDLWDKLPLLILPALTLTLVTVAHMMRMTRAAVLSVMNSPYIEMAELKGIRNWRIVVQHALPNVLSPIINVVILNLAYLVVGVVVVEVVFTYDGLGKYMVDAVSKRDVPVVQACGLIFAMVYVSLNMTADILSILANPRLRHPK